jgi:hypothetical protein
VTPAPTPAATASTAPTPQPTPESGLATLPRAALAAMHAADRWSGVPAPVVAQAPVAATTVGSPYRIDAAPPPSHGFFDTVLGNLLGFFFG